MKIFRLLTASLLIAVCAELGSCSSEEEIPTLLEIDCQQAENFLSEGIIASPFQCYFEITVTATKVGLLQSTIMIAKKIGANIILLQWI